MDQWDRIESPEIIPHTMDNKSSTKEARIYNGEKSLQQVVLDRCM